MLKIAIVLLTTTGFAALLIVYPFTPKDSLPVATATQVKPAVQPAPVSQSAAVPAPVSQSAAVPAPVDGKTVPMVINGKTVPVNVDGMSTALSRLDAILDAIQTPDSRVPARQPQQPRQDVQTTAAPVANAQPELTARPAPARPNNLAPGPGMQRYPSTTNATPSYGPPSGPLRQRANGPNTNTTTTPTYHVNRTP